jgi:hypothetical protein
MWNAQKYLKKYIEESIYVRCGTDGSLLALLITDQFAKESVFNKHTVGIQRHSKSLCVRDTTTSFL